MPGTRDTSGPRLSHWLRGVAQRAGWRCRVRTLWRGFPGYRLGVAFDRSSWSDSYRVSVLVFDQSGPLSQSGAACTLDVAMHRRLELAPIERALDFTNPLLRDEDRWRVVGPFLENELLPLVASLSTMEQLRAFAIEHEGIASIPVRGRALLGLTAT